jgi:hypothetical protein
MLELTTLSTLEGRAALRDIFRELRYVRQMSAGPALALTWRLATRERELHRFAGREVLVLHPLGFWSGTSLWLQEIVNRFYFSTINSFVYFGAAILLVAVGMRRVYEAVPDWVVIGSISFEALLLAFMFFVMFFSPSDEAETDEQTEREKSDEMKELLREVGEIARDYAVVSVRLEQITDALMEMSARQEALISTTREAVMIAAQAVAPNPALLASMDITGQKLNEFNDILSRLTQAADALRREQIEHAVRRELEKIIADTVASGYVKQS